MFHHFWIIIPTGIGFMGGWISRCFLESIFREDTPQKIIKVRSKRLSREKKSLEKLVDIQAHSIATLCEKQLHYPSKENIPRSIDIPKIEGSSSKIESSSSKIESSSSKIEGSSSKIESSSSKIEGSSSKIEGSSSKIEDELVNIFEEEHQRNSKTVQEKLDIGRKLGNEPISFFTSKQGGFVSLVKIKEAQKESSNFRKEGKLKRADELEIMHSFNNIRGMNYYDAESLIKEEGYSLYPIYVNRGSKIPRSTYSGTVLGVSITDPTFSYNLHKPSTEAVITCIVDIGGQDPENRENPLK